jgi:hypothetical protein
MKTVNMFKLINLGANNDEPDHYYLFVETAKQGFIPPVEDDGPEIELERMLVSEFTRCGNLVESMCITHTAARNLWNELVSIGYKEI